MGFGSKIRINNTDHSIASSLYGTCTDSAGTVGKTVTCADFDTLITGVTIHVKFTYGNTATSPTLNVNGTGAKPIYSNGTTVPGKTKLTSWYDNAIVSFTYDGTAWRMNDVGAGLTSAVTDILNLVYPVGSIYMSVNSTSPATLFGGTWTQIKGRYLVAAGADQDAGTNFVAGTPGGQKTISYTPAGNVGNTTLTANQMPSHTHTFTGTSATTSSAGGSHTHPGPSHTHGLNNHTHSIPALSGTAASNGAHTHKLKYYTYKQGGGGSETFIPTNDGTSEVDGLVVSAGAHTHSVTTTASTTEGSSASTAAAGNGATGSTSIAHTHTLTAKGTNANTGGGGGHNHGFTGTAATLTTLSPYLPVYVWQRTA